MAVVQGVQEMVHLPLYDALKLEPEEQLRSVESSSTLKFFVNVQGKTKLETNLQSASQLSHYNTFEARAMRVVISDLPPEFPDEPTVTSEDLPVTDEEDTPICSDATGTVGDCGPIINGGTLKQPVVADIELGLFSLVELLKEAQQSEDGFVAIPVDDEEEAVTALRLEDGTEIDDTTNVKNIGGVVFLSAFDVENLIDELGDDAAPREQIFSNNGSGTLIGKLIYNTVTTLFVGEKIMMQAPTWMFPAGAGPVSEQATSTTNGVPSPMDTFRFATPVNIDKQQNFRVEIEVPDNEVFRDIQRTYGPLFIWVVLDGYLTRDVQ